METIRKYFKLIVGGLLVILTGAFLFERSRRKSAEAVADNKEMLDEINKGDQNISKNNGLLEAEEVKRKEAEENAEDRKNDGSDANADWFKKRNR